MLGAFKASVTAFTKAGISACINGVVGSVISMECSGFYALVWFSLLMAAQNYLVCMISLLRMRWTPDTHHLPPTSCGVGWQLYSGSACTYSPPLTRFSCIKLHLLHKSSTAIPIFGWSFKLFETLAVCL